MVNAQEWLEKYYSDKSTKRIIYPNKIEVRVRNNQGNLETKEKDFSEPLKGKELIIDNYPQLKEIVIQQEVKISLFSFLINNREDKEVGIVEKITVSNCPQLTKIIIKKINCQELVLQNIPRLQYLNISDNKITGINLIEQRELIHLNTENNPLAKPLFSFLNEKPKHSTNTGIRNILLVGRTNSGKSTLANVLSGKNNFEEGKGGESKTVEAKSEEFEVKIDTDYFKNEKVKYRVIDTIGIDDTRLVEKEVLKELAKTCQKVKESGLSQILFLIRGKFTNEEYKAYNLLKNTVFNEEIGNYTTIIRTDFVDFEEEVECEKETIKMKKADIRFVELMKECNNKLIYLNNPSAEIIGKRAEAQNSLNQELREASREKVLKYLILNFTNYYPENLDRLNERIYKYLTDNERLEKKVEHLEKINKTNIKINQEQKKANKREIRELKAQIEQKNKELQSKWCAIT